jgi:hypothetical protein
LRIESTASSQAGVAAGSTVALGRTSTAFRAVIVRYRCGSWIVKKVVRLPK